MCQHMLFNAPLHHGQVEPRLHVSARVMELPGFPSTTLYKVPRGQRFPLVEYPIVNVAAAGHTWLNLYGFVGMAPSRPQFDEFPIFADGLNEAGLSCAALWCPGTRYPEPGSGNNLFYADFVPWALGRFATVAELEKELKSGAVRLFGPKADSKFYMPLHFISVDSTGACLVVECMNGEMQVYGQEYEARHHDGLGATVAGALSNAPSYDWHRTNITFYGNFTPFSEETSTTKMYPPPGCGQVGLPADASSPSRFVRAAFYQQAFSRLPKDGGGWLPAPQRTASVPLGGEPYSHSVQTLVNVALQATQIVMGTPYGTLLSETPEGGSKKVGVGDYCNWTVVRDHTNKTLYYTSAFNNLLQRIDLNGLKFDDRARMPDFPSIAVIPPARNEWYQEATGAFVQPR
ncbi:linear amide C-N hydrolase [Trinickia fusca]|uniref:Linear amide C-N hydrolase n=1 Tax=Trinickia fusca TaxID=2419777 RepID=A0A494XA45_9BURK|nr:linear amide C-N hydrolase [Trinickia fusca]RKP47625.1 linear amide C-N hydrolase [Trinickia fusca]